MLAKLPETLKADEPQLPGVIRRLFSVSPGTEFKTFLEHRMYVNKIPDVFLANLRHLLNLAGHASPHPPITKTLFFWNSFCMDCLQSLRKNFIFPVQGSQMKISARGGDLCTLGLLDSSLVVVDSLERRCVQRVLSMES